MKKIKEISSKPFEFKVYEICLSNSVNQIDKLITINFAFYLKQANFWKEEKSTSPTGLTTKYESVKTT